MAIVKVKSGSDYVPIIDTSVLDSMLARLASIEGTLNTMHPSIHPGNSLVIDRTAGVVEMYFTLTAHVNGSGEHRLPFTMPVALKNFFYFSVAKIVNGWIIDGNPYLISLVGAEVVIIYWGNGAGTVGDTTIQVHIVGQR